MSYEHPPQSACPVGRYLVHLSVIFKALSNPLLKAIVWAIKCGILSENTSIKD